LESENHTILYLVGIVILLILIPITAFASLVPIAALPFFRAEQANQLFEGGEGGPTGEVTSEVPSEYARIFKMAGSKFQVQPAFLAAIFWKEHGKSFPNINGPWATSPKGAQGPFQFMPGTWQAHKQDCNGDGIMDVQNIWDAACGAAHLLSQIGAGGNNNGDTPEKLSKLKDAASRYNSGCQWEPDPDASPRCRAGGQAFSETADYVPDVIAGFQKFYSQAELVKIFKQIVSRFLYYNRSKA
jgi:hypothetical protein